MRRGTLDMQKLCQGCAHRGRTMWGHSKEAAFCKPGRETHPADTLTWDSQPPRLWENEFLLLKPPSLRYFVMASLAHYYTASPFVSTGYPTDDLRMKHVSSCPGLKGNCAFFILTRLPKPPKLPATAPQHLQLICTLSITSSMLHPSQWVRPENKSGTMIHKWMNAYFDIPHSNSMLQGEPSALQSMLFVPLVLQCQGQDSFSIKKNPTNLESEKEYINISELLWYKPETNTL